MKNLVDYLRESEEDIETAENTAIPGGVDVALAGEISYWSERDDIFQTRKQAIADRYKNEIRNDIDWNADYIAHTPIFKMYLDDLVKYYKSNVDDKARLNVSTYDELARQIADQVILLVKNTVIR